MTAKYQADIISFGFKGTCAVDSRYPNGFNEAFALRLPRCEGWSFHPLRLRKGFLLLRTIEEVRKRA